MERRKLDSAEKLALSQMESMLLKWSWKEEAESVLAKSLGEIAGKLWDIRNGYEPVKGS